MQFTATQVRLAVVRGSIFEFVRRGVIRMRPDVAVTMIPLVFGRFPVIFQNLCPIPIRKSAASLIFNAEHQKLLIDSIVEFHRFFQAPMDINSDPILAHWWWPFFDKEAILSPTKCLSRPTEKYQEFQNVMTYIQWTREQRVAWTTFHARRYHDIQSYFAPQYTGWKWDQLEFLVPPLKPMNFPRPQPRPQHIESAFLDDRKPRLSLKERLDNLQNFSLMTLEKQRKFVQKAAAQGDWLDVFPPIFSRTDNPTEWLENFGQELLIGYEKLFGYVEPTVPLPPRIDLDGNPRKIFVPPTYEAPANATIKPRTMTVDRWVFSDIPGLTSYEMRKNSKRKLTTSLVQFPNRTTTTDVNIFQALQQKCNRFFVDPKTKLVWER